MLIGMSWGSFHSLLAKIFNLKKITLSFLKIPFAKVLIKRNNLC